ncbi:MAG: hypothetical protein II092_00035, partial [Lachnospiraceae bacterium]|nr:hypothetical protein [Lachnospiraceae bacterium]
MMKRNNVIRLLGFALSFVIATSNITSTVYAAESTNVVVEDVVEPTTDTLDSEEIEDTEGADEDANEQTESEAEEGAEGEQSADVNADSEDPEEAAEEEQSEDEVVLPIQTFGSNEEV